MADILATYGWWILGLVLLALELAAPGVYLLFFGIAALVVGTNAFLFPGLGWQSEVIGFAVVSLVAVLLGHKWYGQRGTRTDGTDLNHRTRRLIGRTATLSEAIEGGRGRVSIEDGWWTVEGPDLPRGARVVIKGADGSVLTVRPAEPGPPDLS
ncbi:NfeD family protein [Aureimonas populi]|uniref:NfeD family protein n=1 Tax=Aureimonas populi TaxID=1701758 RepID=A0ABW5CI47_9HYPH|nr:NfeD family protein [Aureimonas populi]